MPSTTSRRSSIIDMSRRVLIVTAVDAEADAIEKSPGMWVTTGGIGRTNAAAATTAAILERGPFAWVVSAGVGGALPGGNLSIGDVVVADRCVYAEEGLATPSGFQDMKEMGFSLGNFDGNVVPVDPAMLAWAAGHFSPVGIATVATCSGTDEQASMVAARTGCACEAMEGAAVVHAARRLGAAAIELRSISNTTGDRDAQEWDLSLALDRLGAAVTKMTGGLWSA